MSTACPLRLDALRGLPGAELVLAGLDALVALGVNNGGCESGRAVRSSQAPTLRTTTANAPEFPIEALLVVIGARRLRRAGVPVPDVPGVPDQPELALYEAVARRHPTDAHSRYNALVRRLVSFERTVEALSARTAQGGDRAERRLRRQ